MFTFKITNKSLDKESNIITLTVEYTDGTTTVVQNPRFGTDQTVEQIRMHLKNRAESLSKGQLEFDNITTDEVVDPTTVETDFRTQAEKDRDEWFRKVEKLANVTKLIDLGVVATDNPKVVALRDDISATLKVAYIDQL